MTARNKTILFVLDQKSTNFNYFSSTAFSGVYLFTAHCSPKWLSCYCCYKEIFSGHIQKHKKHEEPISFVLRRHTRRRARWLAGPKHINASFSSCGDSNACSGNYCTIGISNCKTKHQLCFSLSVLLLQFLVQHLTGKTFLFLKTFIAVLFYVERNASYQQNMSWKKIVETYLDNSV